jgi:hypothetical protein
MKKFGIAVSIAAATLLVAATALAQNGTFQGHGRAVVTVLPAHPNGQDTQVSLQDVKIKVGGRQASVTGWTPLRGDDANTQIVLLIDGSARRSLGEQLGDISEFVKEVPSHTKIAIAYMEYGRAVFAAPLSSDPAVVLRGLHLPSGFAYANGSPYFCLSNLATHWPSQDRAARSSHDYRRRR